MGNMTAFAGERIKTSNLPNETGNRQIFASITRLCDWLERHDYRGYDTFDGLNARYLRPLTFENNFLRQILQQAVRRFPINLRPLVGVEASRSTKGMAFIAKGFMRLHSATNEPAWADKARMALDWLIEKKSPGYSGACWGNHFDYQSRSSFIPKGTPTIVWTALVGHVLLDAYEHFCERRFLDVAISACEHIVNELDRFPDGQDFCFSYHPGATHKVHNANTLGASLLARTNAIVATPHYLELALASFNFTAKYQRPDGSWYYGEQDNLHWVDNFHTAYVLDCFKYFREATGDTRYDAILGKGYEYWKKTFFLEDGTPKYYNHKTLPLDIQCCSQAIDTLVFFSDGDAEAPEVATRVAKWTIENMQDASGYFYYRRYASSIVNKTPTLHWGQATMLSALAGLYELGPKR
jgi:rhamnogalacturonyl hydrolase YesR